MSKKFTFYTVRAAKAEAAANPQGVDAATVAVARSGIRRVDNLDDELNGQIKCIITPEKAVSVCPTGPPA